MITNIRNLSLVVVAALALALSACGGGGGSGPVTDQEPMPKVVNLDSVAASAMRPATEEPIVIAPGQSIVHGDVTFSCAAGGPVCTVTVSEDGTASSTGGMVTATNSEAFVQRMTVANAIGVAESAISALSDMSTDAEIAAAESLLAAARSALADATALSTLDRETLNERIQTVQIALSEAAMSIEEARHAIMRMEQAILAVSTAIDELELLAHALSRTSSDADVAAVEALLAHVWTALEEAATFLPMADRDMFSGRIQSVETTLASIKTDMAAHRMALANVIDLAANDNRQDVLGEFIGGWWWREPGTGGQQASVTRSYDGGGSVNAILSYDENGQLQHNVAIFQNKSYQQVETTDMRVRMDRTGRYINTYEDPQELEGVTRSTRSISDHGLGAEWQVTELTSDYDGGGTLKIHVATDVEPADGSVDPFATVTSGYGNIELSEEATLPADWDFMVVSFDPGHIEEGSLGEDAGFFHCSEPCYLAIDRRSGGYYAVSTGLVFTPYGGTAQPVPPTLVETAPAADYLAFGHWLYVPDVAAEPGDVPPTLGYDFGVFASGGDPFTAANLPALTGTATYEGDAVGMYYVGGLSGRPDVGSFTADVELTANFGSNVETGTVGGQVSDFEFEGDVASSLPETVTLASRTYDYLPGGFGVEQGTVTNIFDTPWRDEAAPYPGGWVGGATQASVDGQDWYGSWSGAFYGNGPAPTDHPTSVAGEFGNYPWGDGNHNQRDTGLTGSFGAHRQGEATRDPDLQQGFRILYQIPDSDEVALGLPVDEDNKAIGLVVSGQHEIPVDDPLIRFRVGAPNYTIGNGAYLFHKITSSPVTISSEEIGTLVGKRAYAVQFAGIGPVDGLENDYEYVSFGAWAEYFDDGEDFEQVYNRSEESLLRIGGSFVASDEDYRTNVMPRIGRATWSGQYHGVYTERGGPASIADDTRWIGYHYGEMRMTADFERRSVAVLLKDLWGYGDHHATITGTIDTQSPTFMGDKFEIDIPQFEVDPIQFEFEGAKATLEGGFFGPSAEEVGGVYEIRDGHVANPTRFVGAFGGRQATAQEPQL